MDPRPRILITGASSGIGLALAHQLAPRADLVLSARRADRLASLATQLRAAHAGGTVDCAPADLGRADGAAALWAAATAGGPVTGLVCNAGFGYFRAFTAAELARDLELIQLNVTSLVELSHHFVRAHTGTTAGPRYLQHIASIAAFQAIPNFATYAASKAFVRSFSNALHDELRGGPIRVSCVCPGGTATEFHGQAGAGDYGKLANASMLTADQVAAVCARALWRGTRTALPGMMNKMVGVMAPRAPGALASWMASRLMGAPKGELPARLADGGA